MPRILIAEDDAAVRRFVARALSHRGHDVTAVEDGLAALEALEATGFDLLLTDIVMPGLDGIELAQKATDKCPDLKVMFITGFAGVALNNQVQKTNNAKVLSKPFHLNDLVEQVDQILVA